MEYLTMVAGDIIKKHHIVTVKDNDEIYIYNDGIYKDNGIKQVRADAKIVHGDFTKTHIHEIIHHIQSSTYRERGELDTPIEYVQ